MEVFYNLSLPGYEEIVSYGPRWWTEFKEMDAVYMFEGWLLDILAKKMEQEVRNLFPAQADNMSLIDYEKMLGIEHDPNMSVEERMKNVRTYYSGSGHLSRSVIIQIAKTYTGFDVNVFWENGNLYIEFNNADNIFSSIESFQRAVERRMPAHLAHIYRVRRSVPSKAWYSLLTKEMRKITATAPPVFDPIETYTWLTDEAGITLTDENGNILIL